MVSMPRQITNMFSSQNAPKQTQTSDGLEASGPENPQHGIDGLAADPGLNPEPSAGDQRAQNSGEIRTSHAEGSANEHRKRDAVLGPGMRVEQHGRKHDQVAEQNGSDGLPPVHAAGDEARGQHVGGDADAHRDPERQVTIHSPGAPDGRNGRQVLVEQTGIGGHILIVADQPGSDECDRAASESYSKPQGERQARGDLGPERANLIR